MFKKEVDFFQISKKNGKYSYTVFQQTISYFNAYFVSHI